MDLVAVRVLVSGRVQGVFFRSETEARAKSLGLAGYVRNLPDGVSLEVLAEGSRKNLASLVDYLRTGPPHARVENIVIEWSAYTGRHLNFSVK